MKSSTCVELSSLQYMRSGGATGVSPTDDDILVSDNSWKHVFCVLYGRMTHLDRPRNTSREMKTPTTATHFSHQFAPIYGWRNFMARNTSSPMDLKYITWIHPNRSYYTCMAHDHESRFFAKSVIILRLTFGFPIRLLSAGDNVECDIRTCMAKKTLSSTPAHVCSYYPIYYSGSQFINLGVCGRISRAGSYWRKADTQFFILHYV